VEPLLALPAFWRLVDRGYLKVDRPSRDSVRFTAKTYIGTADLDGWTVEIVEKIPGETEILLGRATQTAFRVESLPVRGGPPGRLIALLVTQFLYSLNRYASEGRRGVYRFRTESAPMVGGRIRLVDTIRLRARGFPHLIAFDRTVFGRDTEFNRALMATVMQVERLARTVSLRPGDHVRARTLAAVFEDCVDSRFLATPRRTFLAAFSDVTRDRSASQLHDLAELGAAILDRVSLDEIDPAFGMVPRSWFIDLGRLFEDVVRRDLKKVLSPTLQVQNGAASPVQTFDGTDGYRANPDLVVRDTSDAARAVGDVKHKAWGKAADESDLYQLLAHTAAFGAKDCFLVYPHTEYDEVDLGVNPLGGRTLLFAVDVKDIATSLMRACSAYGWTPVR
jgi:5-methylcytosine-specific restriction endonuclease McrBC regulatory subunit McrC